MRLALTCSYLPREIPLACGLEVFRPWPTREDLGAAEKYLPRNYCPYIRGLVGWLASPGAAAMWGVAMTTCCDAMRRAADTLEYFGLVPHVFLLDLPHTVSAASTAFYREELAEWARKLASALAITWEDRLLEKAIQEMADGCRRDHPADWPDLLPLDYPQPHLQSGHEEGLQVAVGSTCLLDTSVLETLAALGVRVTALDSCLGERDWHIQIEEGGDPFAVLARAYLEKPPCPRMHEESRRQAWLQESVTERGIDGLIWFIPKFCDQASYELARLKREWPDLPVLLLEGEQGAGRQGALRTRLEAFGEELALRKGTGR